LSHTPPCEAPVQLVDAEAKPSAGHAADVPVQVSATSHWPAESRHTVPALPAGCVHAGAPAVPLHTSVVHGLSSSVQLVPAGSTVSDPQLELGGASAMSWLRLAVCEVDAFEPVTPGLACDASALSEAASTELVPLEVSTWNRSVMPDGAPTAKLSERPK